MQIVLEDNYLKLTTWRWRDLTLNYFRGQEHNFVAVVVNKQVFLTIEQGWANYGPPNALLRPSTIFHETKNVLRYVCFPIAWYDIDSLYTCKVELPTEDESICWDLGTLAGLKELGVGYYPQLPRNNSLRLHQGTSWFYCVKANLNLSWSWQQFQFLDSLANIMSGWWSFWENRTFAPWVHSM